MSGSGPGRPPPPSSARPVSPVVAALGRALEGLAVAAAAGAADAAVAYGQAAGKAAAAEIDRAAAHARQSLRERLRPCARCGRWRYRHGPGGDPAACPAFVDGPVR